MIRLIRLALRPSILTIVVATSLLILSGVRPTNAQSSGQPLGMQLTWQQDPTTTMTIDWHNGPEDALAGLQWRPAGDLAWQDAVTQRHAFPFSERIIRRVELTGLEPDTRYEFRFAADGSSYAFRTMPTQAKRPVRFATGGDVRHRQEWMDQTNRVAASYDPDFVLFGGDLAYVNGDPRRIERWYEWFESTMTTLVAPDGRLIPVIAAIGNHEVWHQRRVGDDDAFRSQIQQLGLGDDTATFFFDLFPFPGRPGYNVLDFGDYMSLVLLDTDHLSPVDGEQSIWLERTLAERTDVPHIFPVYHQPAYPSVRRFDSTTPARIREHWVPLFEQHGVRVAFESHDHAYKRTVPIRQGRPAADGIVFMGDGAWGVDVREIGRDHEEPAWYLDRAESVRHFILATVHGPHHHFLMVDEDGAVFDEYPATPRVSIPIGTTTMSLP
jgi:acid phosphatase type 7